MGVRLTETFLAKARTLGTIILVNFSKMFQHLKKILKIFQDFEGEIGSPAMLVPR
jgi:hypothetical protein